MQCELWAMLDLKMADQLTDQATTPDVTHTQGSSQALSTLSGSPYSPNHSPGRQGIPHTAWQ